VVDREELLRARTQVDDTRVSDEVTGYVVNLVRRTRQLPSVSLGASPRAAVHLLVAAKAAARLAERDYVIPDDVAGVATAVLAHRLILTPEAELEGFTAARAVRTAVDDVPIPR
jgi:MoxR-like ATPase